MTTYKHIKRKYTCLPDALSNTRRMRYKTSRRRIKIPKAAYIDTSNWKIHDQQSENSCVGYASARAVEFYFKNSVQLSPLFIYWWARKIDKYVNVDGGARPASAMRCLHEHGVCEERYLKSVPNTNADVFIEPSIAAQVNAVNYKISSYFALTTLVELKTAIFKHNPVIAGVPVYKSMESRSVANSGHVSLPAANETLLGGHAIVLVGYSDITHEIKFCNSWGPTWGDKGYGYLPYDYFKSFDAWELVK